MPTAAAPVRQSMLFGRDETPGIVAVNATRAGVAQIWRRIGDQVQLATDHFTPWIIASDAAALGLAGDDVAALPTDGPLALPNGASFGVARLRGANPWRDLILARDFNELERRVQSRHAESGQPIGSLRDLRGQVYVRNPVEQYLMLTGRGYFKGMTYTDLHRLQFDLEGTGLNPRTSELLMIAVRDSRGLATTLDVTAMSEGELIAEFVRLVRERDPDVIENHNLFGFDIPYLIHRASVHNVPLTLGRDGSTFGSYQDSLKVGAANESFTRYTVAGRELIDTLHAVKRYGALTHDMRGHGLKEAARYFGLAKPDREYVDGAQVGAVFRQDPERIRRYALDDVEDVAELSRLLMGASFALASMVPRQYEKVATAGTAQGLIEPLLARAYLDGRCALPNGADTGSGEAYAGARTELFASGVIRNVVKADVASLYPSIMLRYRVAPKHDELGAFLGLLDELTKLRLFHKTEARRHPSDSRERIFHDALQAAMKILINSFYGALGTSFHLFGDIAAAAEVTRIGRELLTQMLVELERRGMTLIEADTDGVLFSVPAGWTQADEQRLVDEVSAALPEGINVEHDGRYRAVYSYMEKNYALLDWAGKLKLVGVAFKSSRSERYAERFLRRAILALLEDRPADAHAAYVDTILALRERRTPLEELNNLVTLTKTPAEYRAAGRAEEQYEVLLAAGQTEWKPGDRVAYYRARGGRRRIIEQYANDYDVEHYVKKLQTAYAQRLAKAVAPEDFNCLFGEQRGLFDPDPADVHTIVTVERTAAGSTQPPNPKT